MVTFIQQNTSISILKRERRKILKFILKILKIKKRQLTQFEKGKVLLREPVYLNNKTIGGFDDFNVDKNNLEYNYNYSISLGFSSELTHLIIKNLITNIVPFLIMVINQKVV